MAVLDRFVDAFNTGDVKSAPGACADQVSIVDEFAPYEWHGAGACATWANASAAAATKKGITDGIVLHKSAAGWRITAWTWAKD